MIDRSKSVKIRLIPCNQFTSKGHQLSGTFPFKQVLILKGKMKLAKKNYRNYHNTHGEVRQLIEEGRVTVPMRSEKGKPI